MSRLPEHLLDHLRNPRNVGEPSGEPIFRGEARNPACRDHLVLWFTVAGGAVTAAGFRAAGCPACLAYGSASTEVLVGLPAGPGLAAAAEAALTERHGPPPGLHRHALKLVAEALTAAAAPGG